MPARKTKNTEENPETKPAADKPKYTVNDLAEALGNTDASVRVALRDLEIPKNGKRYSWNRKTEFDAVVKQLKERSTKQVGRPPADKASAKKPAAKKPAAKKAETTE